MAYTVRTAIRRSFEDLGVIQPGDTFDGTSMETAAFDVIQLMVNNWNAELTMGFLWVEGSFTPIAGTRAYTFGAGGTFTTGSAIPVEIVSASSVSGNRREPCEVMSFQKFHSSVRDSLSSRSVLASIVAVDQNFPLMNVLVHPMPDTSPGTLDLGYWTKLAQFAAVTDDISAVYPPEWFAALHFGLAMALYPQYARTADPAVLASNFQVAKGAIAAKNARILGLQNQAA